MTARSDFQLLRETRQLPVPVLGYDDHVFVANASQARIIQPRLDREDLSIFQGHFLQARIFVDLEPESVSGAVEKPNLPAFAHFRAVTAFGKEILNRLV